MTRKFSSLLAYRDPFTLLTSHQQALHQRLRKFRFAHTLLHGGYILLYAPELHRLMLQIGDGKCGPRVSVARLADGSRIQKIPVRRLEAQRRERFVQARVNLQNFQLGIQIGKSALVMGMTEKRYLRGGIEQPFQRLSGSENIFILILKSAMDENDAVGGERSPRKIR